MKFCKKCHKLIIKKIFTRKDLGSRCRCNDEMILIIENSEMDGIIKKELSKVKRNGMKRRLIKSKISE